MESPRKKILLKLLIPWLLFFAASSTAVYFWHQAYLFKSEIPESPQQEIAQILAAVGKLIILPADETPTIATVTNVQDAQKEWPELFANAKVGDKVLMYSQAQKAILYDPVADKIIDTAPFSANPANISTTATTTATSTSVSQKTSH